jgi:hypothetical protein
MTSRLFLFVALTAVLSSASLNSACSASICSAKGCTAKSPCLGPDNQCYDFSKNECVARDYCWCDECPPGQRIDLFVAGGDNGSCDCNNYCASNWAGEVKRSRPNWKGSTCYEASFTNVTTGQNQSFPCSAGAPAGHSAVFCLCQEADFFCPPKYPTDCYLSCNVTGVPPATGKCVPV